MFFILKVVISLTAVFLMLPEKDADRVASEVKRAVAQDKIMKSAVDRTNLAAMHAVKDAQKLCGANADECMETAKQIVKGATSRW